MASSPSPCPMLSIPEKKPAPADLYPALHHHVSTHYSEHEAQLNDHDLRAVHTLRSDLVRPLPPSARRDLLLSYSRALSAALPRLPSLPVHLTWHDAFRPSRKATAQGLPFDRAATLFCLASTYTHLAAAEDRRSEDGRKAACNAYLAAAGALGFLRLRASPEVKAAAVTVDLTPECVGMLEKLMLAQAQECFFEKVVADGKACAICSKVARQRQHEALGAQRASLVDMLKEMKRKDGILLKLMATSGSDEDLFKKEISKYDPICEDIVQNTRAQENLLHEIQVQNDEFSAIFNLEDYKVQRERCYKQIAAAVAKFKEIKANINGGLKFYVTLQEAIANVKQQCSDFVTRGIECQETIQDVQAKIANFDISSDERTGYKYPSSLPTPCRPQQIDPRNEQQYPPYTQEPPFQHPNQVRQQYQPPSAPPLQEPNPRDGLPNQPYQRLPPPQQPNPWDGLPYQPSPRMPEPWTTPAHQPYPQPPPYYQPPYEQRYPQPPSYPSYVTAPQPPPYASPTANFYQPPPPGPLLQPPCTEYGQHACYCPQHHGAPPQHTAAYNGLEQYPPYGSYLGVPK